MVWGDDQFGQGVARLGRLQPTPRIDKADTPDIDLLANCRLKHDLPDHVVNQRKNLQLSQHAIDGLALEHVHLHRGFHLSKIGFDLPSLTKLLRQVRR